DTLMPTAIPACREGTDRLTDLQVSSRHLLSTEAVEAVLGGASNNQSAVERDLKQLRVLLRLVRPPHPPDDRSFCLRMPRVGLYVLARLSQVRECPGSVYRGNDCIPGQTWISRDDLVRLPEIRVR